MTDLQRFGERLAQLRREKAARERRDLGQKDVADAAGVSAANYSKYEAGLVKPRDDVLGQLAAYFGVHRAWLLWGEGDRSPSATADEELVAEPAPPRRGAGRAKVPRKGAR